MSIVELKTKMHERIEHLSEEQLKKLQEIVEKEFNHDLHKKSQSKERDLFGCMKGVVIYMADDFNEPLEDFKEYMPD